LWGIQVAYALILNVKLASYQAEVASVEVESIDFVHPLSAGGGGMPAQHRDTASMTLKGMSGNKRTQAQTHHDNFVLWRHCPELVHCKIEIFAQLQQRSGRLAPRVATTPPVKTKSGSLPAFSGYS
jgi:hypothetical protein